MSRRAWLGCAVSLVATACIPAPTYRAAFPKGARYVGFDPSRTQLARWTCWTFDFVLANDPVDGRVLHEMNRDFVVKADGKVAGGGDHYRFGITSREGEAPLGSLDVEVVVSDDLDAPIDVKATEPLRSYKLAYVTTTEYEIATLSCRRAPAVEVYR